MPLIDEILRNERIRDALADHFRHGIAAAVSGYEDSSADEDSLTGALGQALRGSGVLRLPGRRRVHWSTRYRKFRGRGRNAPEKKLGADGLFEVVLKDEEDLESRKSLPFQAKNNASSYRDRNLREQASKIGDFPGGGIIVNYRPENYVAVDAAQVALGDATRDSELPLADALSDFLACRRGSSAYVYERGHGILLLKDGGLLIRRPWFPRHRVRTTLRLR